MRRPRVLSQPIVSDLIGNARVGAESKERHRAPIKQSLLAVGASPVMWLMFALSIASVAVILERAFVFIRIHEDASAMGVVLRARACTRAREARGSAVTRARRCTAHAARDAHCFTHRR